jgi:hypothetical protein
MKADQLPSLSELPAEEIPVGEIPVGEIPVGEIPVGEIPVRAWQYRHLTLASRDTRSAVAPDAVVAWPLTQEHGALPTTLRER